MSTPGGAVAPYDASAGAVSPSGYIKPQSVAVAKFAQVMRDILGVVQVYHNEADLDQAHRTITEYIKQMTDPADRSRLVSEGDQAPKEDVSERVPPTNRGPATAPAGFGPIDYNKLAAALVAAQQAQAAPEPEVHVITDVPEAPAPEPPPVTEVPEVRTEEG